MVGHGGSSAGSYLADPTSLIPSHCASIVVTSTLRVKQRKTQTPIINKNWSFAENGGAGEVGVVSSPATNAEVESLRQELAELRASTVSKEQYEQLQNELWQMKENMERWQAKHSKLLTDLMEEVDEEKKIRLATEVEMKRIKKMVQP